MIQTLNGHYIKVGDVWSYKGSDFDDPKAGVFLILSLSELGYACRAWNLTSHKSVNYGFKGVKSRYELIARIEP